MEIVINISEEEYNKIKENDMGFYNGRFFQMIRNGTPLPKGHGRLIDISRYEDKYFNVAISFDDGNHIHEVYTNMISTVIEKDAESEE